jgi:uncharacterized protein YggE
MKKPVLWVIPLLLLGVVLSACSGTVKPVERSISVTGTGTVSLAPDIAYIYIGVSNEGPDLAQEVSVNNSQADALSQALQAAGVALADIQTSNFSIYSNGKQFDPQDGKYLGVTYTVNNTVNVTVRDLTRLGELLRAAVSSGANTINSISFDLADKSAAQAEARIKAMDNAKSLAGELAGIAAVNLGEVQTINYTEYTYSPYAGMGGGGAYAPNASVPIQPGQIQVSVSVNVTYGIK